MAWPVPHRFELFGLQTFGYEDEVVFPLTARPETPGAPLDLEVTVSFLVCEEICVPHEEIVRLALPAEDGSLICGVRGGLHRFDPATGRFEMILAVEEDRPQNRLNDGFVAPDGALWFGSMDDSEAGKTGALYRWAHGKLERKDDGYGVTNGPALSPDGRTLYHNDTLDKKTYAFDCAEGGVLSNKRLFATMDEGFCDGPSVDSAGTVHIGLFNGWGIARFAPDGTSLGKIEMPVPAITKAVFGDDDLKTLYITTARLHQSDEQLAQTPTAGGLFRLRVDTPGQAQNLIKL